MIKLIINEIKKIFLRKNVYIMLMVVIAFIFYSNYILKEENTNNYASSAASVEAFEESLNKIDPETSPDRYILIKNALDCVKLLAKYPENTWQYNILIINFHYKYINDINYYAFSTSKDEVKMLEAMNVLDEFLLKLDDGNWKSIVSDEITFITKKIKKLQESLPIIENDSTKNIMDQIALLEIEMEVLNERLNKNINYTNDYLDIALTSYQKNSQAVVKLKPESYRNKYIAEQQLQSLVEEIAINKYVIETKIDSLGKNFHPSLSTSVYDQYDIFILILILLISGGIVSEEFSRGTIKLLLIRPHSRVKILLSKYITVLLMIIFGYFVISATQVAIETIISGTGNFKPLIATYNFNTYTVNSYNIFTYIFIDFIQHFPVYIILITLSFAISTVFTSTTLGITLPVIGMLGGSAINYTVMRRQMINLKYFITLNWDFPIYMNGKLPQLEGITWQFSLIVTLAYLVILLLITFLEFKRKNIKNI